MKDVNEQIEGLEIGEKIPRAKVNCEIKRFDMLGSWCVPQVGSYGNNYNFINIPLVAKLPIKVNKLPTEVWSAATCIPTISSFLTENGELKLPALRGRYYFPDHLVLPNMGRGSFLINVLDPTSDLAIIFSMGPYPCDPVIEVCLGGWGNQLSVIRYRFGGPLIASYPGAVQEGWYWITVLDGAVWVGKGNKVNNPDSVFMSSMICTPLNHYDDFELQLHQVTNIGLCTYNAPARIIANIVTPSDTDPTNLQNISKEMLSSLLPKTFVTHPLSGNYIFPLHMQLPQKGQGAFTFRLETFTDNAWISISPGPMEFIPMVEIVLGGWDNTKSALRMQKTGANIAFHDTNIIQGQTYWVAIFNGRVSVGSGDTIGKDVIMWICGQPTSQLKQICFGGWQSPITYADVTIFDIKEPTPKYCCSG